MQNNSLFKPIFQDFNLSHFLFPNSIAKQKISQLIEQIKKNNQSKPSLTLLLGDKGCGKSHLLKAMINLANENQLSSLYLGFNQQTIANLFTLTDGLDLLCLDNIETITDENQALMLYELVNKNKIYLIFATNRHPSELDIINDLKTRLLSGQLITINPLADNQMVEAFKLKCSAKGIHLSDKVVTNFLKQTQRNMHQIIANLDNLVIFARGRKITSKMVNQFFESHRK